MGCGAIVRGLKPPRTGCSEERGKGREWKPQSQRRRESRGLNEKIKYQDTYRSYMKRSYMNTKSVQCIQSYSRDMGPEHIGVTTFTFQGHVSNVMSPIRGSSIRCMPKTTKKRRKTRLLYKRTLRNYHDAVAKCGHPPAPTTAPS